MVMDMIKLLPMQCFVLILNFLENYDLISMPLLSKQIYEDIRTNQQSDMAKMIIPVYEISPRTTPIGQRKASEFC